MNHWTPAFYLWKKLNTEQKELVKITSVIFFNLVNFFSFAVISNMRQSKGLNSIQIQSLIVIFIW